MNVKCIRCGVVHNLGSCPNCGSPANPEIKLCKHCKSMIDLRAKVCPICKRKQDIGVLAILLIIFSSIIGTFFLIIVLTGIIATSYETQEDKPTILSTTDNSKYNTNVTPETSKIDNPKFNVGDTIKSVNMEVTINKIEFSYDVLPDNTNSYYSHYEADDGSVYIHIDTDVKNLSKKDLDCDDILSVSADYNDGYIYNGKTIVEDGSSSFTYAILSSIDPLKTHGVHFIINCPEEVVETDYPLFLKLKLHGTNDTYKYVIRE